MTLAPFDTLAAFSPMRHSLGKVVATAAVMASVPEQVIIGLLDRHSAGDWGGLDDEDKAAIDSDHSHAEGRLLSSYDTPEHGTIWVITEEPAARRVDRGRRFRPETAPPTDGCALVGNKGLRQLAPMAWRYAAA